MGPFFTTFMLLIIAIFSIVIFVLPYLITWHGWKMLNAPEGDVDEAFNCIVMGGLISIVWTLLALDGIYYFFVWLISAS